MDKKTFYITTPIYYPNNKLHIGHSYTTVAADTMARYKKLRGFDVCLLTGTDEHGLKIERKAAETGRPVMEYLDGIIAWIKDLWKLLDIDYDIFIRTTDGGHVTAVQKIFRRLYDQGDIYKAKYEGLYCVPDEAFYTYTQAPDGVCPDCGRPLEKASEEAYFLRLGKYQAQLEQYLKDNPKFIQPESRLNEMVNNFLKPGLEDLCVSRTSFKWGIPVDFDPGHVVYVWLDALSNYITALGYGSEDDSRYRKYWPADVHFVGKEIVRFHTIIWPIILTALGEPLPKRVFGHGWLLIGDAKMSKSTGNVVDPKALVARFGVDAVRYFLMREVAFGADGNFTNELLIRRINADLANDFGNLLSRTVSMIQKYFGGALPESPELNAESASLSALSERRAAEYEKAMDSFGYSDALERVFDIVRAGNKLVDVTKPWELGRDMERNGAELAGVLYALAETLRMAAIMLGPVMPNTPEKVFERLGVTDPAHKTWESLKFGAWKTVAVRTGGVLFPRLDVKKELEEMSAEELPVSAPGKPLITIGDFARVELKIGVVESCERLKGSDKLLVSRVRLGGEIRRIVSGIANWRSPDEMLGKRVVVAANLKPAKIMGVNSEGMLLAAEDEAGGFALLTTDAEVSAGAVVS
ncbi:MAG: methionine--tRNA ligase [Clostridiales bacterium]|jgi:methionyl-tRNA synthetase|nr:methionine--tRNA ligase [Clostridiales bacterium]